MSDIINALKQKEENDKEKIQAPKLSIENEILLTRMEYFGIDKEAAIEAIIDSRMKAFELLNGVGA